jgi:hypothetical protein
MADASHKRGTVIQRAAGRICHFVKRRALHAGNLHILRPFGSAPARVPRFGLHSYCTEQIWQFFELFLNDLKIRFHILFLFLGPVFFRARAQPRLLQLIPSRKILCAGAQKISRPRAAGS